MKTNFITYKNFSQQLKSNENTQGKEKWSSEKMRPCLVGSILYRTMKNWYMRRK